VSALSDRLREFAANEPTGLDRIEVNGLERCLNCSAVSRFEKRDYRFDDDARGDQPEPSGDARTHLAEHEWRMVQSEEQPNVKLIKYLNRNSI
jgi:hypothetical protein